MKQINGTSYHDDTPDDVIRVLENARQGRVRLHISYGDRTTGLGDAVGVLGEPWATEAGEIAHKEGFDVEFEGWDFGRGGGCDGVVAVEAEGGGRSGRR